jgi:hypothetical protein
VDAARRAASKGWGCFICIEDLLFLPSLGNLILGTFETDLSVSIFLAALKRSGIGLTLRL